MQAWMFSLQCNNFEVLLYASKIYKFGLQLCTIFSPFSPFNCWVQYFCPFFFSFSIVGFNFCPLFGQINWICNAWTLLAQDYIEMLQCMVYLKVFTKRNLKLLKFEKPHPKQKFAISNYIHRCAPLWPSYIRLISLWAKFMR